MADPHISPIIPTSAQAAQRIEQEVAEEVAMQVESAEDLSEYFETSVFNPLLQAQRFRDFKELKHTTHKPEAEENEEGKKVVEAEKIDEAAAQFQQRNPELKDSTLKILRSMLKPGDTPEEILEKVLSVYPDPTLADEALDFLIETSDPDLLKALVGAKEKLNQERGREVIAGKNMGELAREFSKEGLGSPTSLRDLYRDVTGTPREPIKLFEELTEQFPYTKLKPAISFLLHSLGQDMKSKGPSIARPELQRLLDETRSLQGILGIFRFFQSRMRLIGREFASYQLILPPRLDFELLSKAFVKIVAERYMNPDKLRQIAKALGISEELAAQLIIYTQMRDALKQIAPRYFRNLQHREELTKVLLDTLEEIEDELEEEEEKEKEKGGDE